MNSWESDKIGARTCVWVPAQKFSVTEIIFSALLFFCFGEMLQKLSIHRGKQILLFCGFSLSTQANYCNDFMTALSLLLGFHVTVQHLFPFLAFGAAVLPRGDVIHTGEREEQFIRQGTGTGSQGRIKV